VIRSDAIFTNQRKQLVALAAQRRLPSMYGAGEYAEDGGLMAYSANLLDLERRAATFVDKILKGPSLATSRSSSPRNSRRSSTSKRPRRSG